MTPIDDDTRSIEICQDDFQAMLREQVRLAVRCTLVTILNEEVDAFIGAGRCPVCTRRSATRNSPRRCSWPAAGAAGDEPLVLWASLTFPSLV